MCAWCGRVRLDGEWDWAPTGAIAAIEPTSLTHSICYVVFRRADRRYRKLIARVSG